VSAAPIPDSAYPADPYPGATPDCSFVHLAALSHPIVPTPGAPSRWHLADGPTPATGPSPATAADLDDWLAARDAAPLAGRFPVLGYGSNRCPSKITWLRDHLGLTGPVVVLRVRTEGIAAVWAAGLRARDGQRPATLAAAPGVTERHALWLATAEQLAVLDVCEGRGERYRLVRLRSGRVRTEDGMTVDRPWCYLGGVAARRPLLVHGGSVRCADLDQRAARDLRGVPADRDGLIADEVTGPPARAAEVRGPRSD
jgi:hypothetical protein